METLLEELGTLAVRKLVVSIDENRRSMEKIQLNPKLIERDPYARLR
ncbi:MAG: hypothetical protein KAT88_01545 [Spirochaetes bacterium]|nr:hypothetical protein [Spirochaetota bacterium]